MYSTVLAVVCTLQGVFRTTTIGLMFEFHPQRLIISERLFSNPEMTEYVNYEYVN